MVRDDDGIPVSHCHARAHRSVSRPNPSSTSFTPSTPCHTDFTRFGRLCMFFGLCHVGCASHRRQRDAREGWVVTSTHTLRIPAPPHTGSFPRGSSSSRRALPRPGRRCLLRSRASAASGGIRVDLRVHALGRGSRMVVDRGAAQGCRIECGQLTFSFALSQNGSRDGGMHSPSMYW